MLNSNMEYLFQILVVSLTAVLTVFLVFKNYTAYKKNTDNKTTPFLFHIALLASVAALPVLVLILIIFWIYRQLIIFILFLKYGSKFGGMLYGIDATHTTSSAIKTPVHFLFVIQYNENRSQNFFEFVQEAIHKICLRKLSKIPKIFSSLECSFGYFYLLKNEILFEDCFKQLKRLNSSTNEIDKDDLMRLISEYSDYPLPKHSKALWDVLVGTQAVKWTNEVDNDKKKFYPIIFRFNHSLTDGLSLLEAILNIFADKENAASDILNNNIDNSISCCNDKKLEVMLKDVTKTNTETKHFVSSSTLVVIFCVYVINTVKYYVQILYAIGLIPSAVLIQAWFKKNDPNILYGPQLSNKKIVSLTVEESPRYMEIVKRIKNKVEGSTVTDVFLTAISASLNEYFEQKSVRIPDYILAAVPASREAAKILNTTKVKLNKKKRFCQNNTSMFVPKIPIKIKYEDADTILINRLRLIQKEGSLFRNSRAYETNYWVLRIFGTVFTTPVGEFLAKLNECTIGISNLPGISNITVFEGYPLQDVVFWLANRERTGVAFSIFTYGGRLQMGLLVDKVLISNQSEVDEILNGVYKYLNLLDYQVNSSITVKL